MENYFYTCDAQERKIYVFRNFGWINQLIKIGELFCWVSINRCDMNWNIAGSPQQTIQAAIEDVMEYGYTVYQLDTLEELAEFILEEK